MEITVRFAAKWPFELRETGNESWVRIPGGLSARLTLPRVTFLLSPVRGVRRDRLPEAVKSAIRLVRLADFQAVAVGSDVADAWDAQHPV